MQDDDIETSPVFIQDEILDCINGGGSGDATTVSAMSLIDAVFSTADLSTLNDFLKANQCSESAQWCAIQVFESGNVLDLEDCSGYEPFDPCEEIKAQIDDSSYLDKFKELNKETGKQKETGYVENKNGSFTKLNPINNGHSLSLGGLDYENLNGFIHTHLDNFATGKIVDGSPEINQIYRIFSPADVIAFLGIVKESTNAANVYATVISSSGDYTLRFTGDTSDITGLKSADDYREDYKIQLNKYGDERGFLKFLKNQIKIDGIELYKITKPLFSSNYKVKAKTLDDKGKVNTQDCIQ